MLNGNDMPTFKGVIDYRDKKIPFIIHEYELTLFTEQDLVTQFAHEHIHKHNYSLTGQCFSFGNTPQNITVMVERSLGNICYLAYYIVDMIHSKGKYDSIVFESRILDSIFRYKYSYIDYARSGVNLAAEQTEVYSIPFSMNRSTYILKYSIGHDSRSGLLNRFEMHGNTSVRLQTARLDECYSIALLMSRFAKFLTSNSDIAFDRIALSLDGIVYAHLYCRCIVYSSAGDLDVLFYKYPVMKFTSKILDNLAIDLGSKITKSIPLGHISSYGNAYTPHRFIELISSFEYLFEKLEPDMAKKKNFALKDELRLMLDSFPEVQSISSGGSIEISKAIKELRRNIIHGYVYYYDFNNDYSISRLIIVLSDLVQRMSLKLIGFDDDDISEFRRSVAFF